MYVYLCSRKFFNKLFCLEISFYNTLDYSVKKIHIKFIKERWGAVLKVLQMYLPAQFGS